MATDVQRGQLFSKLIRAITVAAREGGSDQDTNPRLRLAVDRALAANMPKDTANRAIERAAGSGTESAAALTLEAYGPGGAALLIEAVTDNRNRTVADIRKILADHGGSLGESGSVAWQFERRGLLTVERAADPDAAELAAIDAGALDIEREGTDLEVSASPEKTAVVAGALARAGAKPAMVQLTNLPQRWITLDPPSMNKLAGLMETLEEHEDVVDVTTNALPPSEQDENSRA